jgi:hypothetical protein
LSPDLFHIFINNIDYADIEERHSPMTRELKTPGLLFADDLVAASSQVMGYRRRLNGWFNILTTGT